MFPGNQCYHYSVCTLYSLPFVTSIVVSIFFCHLVVHHMFLPRDICELHREFQVRSGEGYITHPVAAICIN